MPPYSRSFLGKLSLILCLLLNSPLSGQVESNGIENSQKIYLEVIHDSIQSYRNGENNQRMSYWLGELRTVLKENTDFESREKYLIAYHTFQAVHSFNIVHYQEALAYTDSALTLLESYKLPPSRTAVLSQLANINTELGQMTEANEAYQNALASFKDWEGEVDSIRYYGILLNWTNCLSRLGQFEKVLDYLNRARNYYQKIDHYLYWAITENNMGEIYREIFNENTRAKNHYWKAKTLNEKTGNKFQLGQNFNNLGVVYQALAMSDSSVYFFEKAISTRQSMGDENNAASSMHGLATLYASEGRLNKALVLFLEIYEISKRQQIAEGLYYTSHSLGDVYLEMKQYDSAQVWLKRSLDYGKRFNASEAELPILKSMVKLYEKKRQYEKALEVHKQFKQVSDSVLLARNKESLQSLKSNIEKEAAENDNKFLRELNQLKEAQISQQKKIISYITLAIILFSILILMLLKSLRMQRQAKNALIGSKEKLEKQNELLLLSEQSLEQANKNKDRILSVLGHDLRSPLASLSALIGAFSAQAITREELFSFVKRLKVQTDDSLLALESVLSWAQAQKESGAGLKLELLPVKKYVEESFQIYAPGARAKDLTMEFEAANSKDDRLLADAAMFRSMLGNLLSNAIKFSKEQGAIKVSLSQEEGFYLLQVCDEGIGMSAHRLQELNESAGSLKSTIGTTGEQGRGIGLSLVKDFARMHGGNLKFKLRSEEGICAMLYLPSNNK